MLSHAYNILIYFGVGAPGQGKDVVDGLNATDKTFLALLMATVQLNSAAADYSHVFMHILMSNTATSLARDFKNIFQTQHVHMYLLIL